MPSTVSATAGAAAASSAVSSPTNENLNSCQQLHHQQQHAKSSLTLTQVLKLPKQVLGSGASALQYSFQSPAWQCTFSRDGNWLAVCFGAPNACVRVWKYNDQQQWVLHATLSGVHERTIRSVAFCPLTKAGSCLLAAASFDASVSIWEYSGSSGGEWDCTTQLEGHENEVKSVIWNSTGSLLATCGRDKSVWIWETFLDGSIGGSQDNEFECIAVLNGHEADVKCIQFAPSHGQWGDGDEILLSAGYDDTIKIWAEDGGDWYCASSLAGLHSDTIWSMTLSPGGGRLLSASADGSICILKCYSAQEAKEKFPQENPSGSHGFWKCVGKLPNAHSATIYSIHYAPSKAGHGRIASAGADNRIQIYREVMGSTSDQPMFALDATVEATIDGDVNCVVWHPWDGSVLCSAGDDGTVRLWQFES